MENMLMLKLDEEIIRQTKSERLFNLRRLLELTATNHGISTAKEIAQWTREIEKIEKRI